MEEFRTANNEHECRKVSFHHSVSPLHSAIDLRAEVHDNGNTVAARNENFRLDGHKLSKEVSTDFPVKQADGSNKWYEEYPTKTDPISGVSLLKENDLYAYDQKSKIRSEKAIPHDSEEYKKANEALAVLRAKYTPKVILSLPECKIE